MSAFTWSVPAGAAEQSGWSGSEAQTAALAYDGDLALDDDGDLLIGDDGDLVVTSGIGSILSDITAALAFFRGEWFLDASVGTPYWEQILGVKVPHLPQMEAAIRDRVLKRPGVVSVTTVRLAFDDESRELALELDVATIYGAAQGSGAIGVPA